MKKIALTLLFAHILVASWAQSPIMYRGNFDDGFSQDSTNSFTPNYLALTYYQNPYLGSDDEDGFSVDNINSFTPNYLALPYYQNPYLGNNDEDGFAMDFDMKFVPNYSNLLYYQSMYLGHFRDGFAVDTASYSTPLPVTLLSFEGDALGNKNYLYWKTATEENVSHFAIGKGKDGLAFNTIGQILASGNSQQEQKYDYTDYTDVAGSNYYRLKIIDNDEQFSYSKVIKLRNKENKFSILLAPNPATDYLSIKFSEALQQSNVIVRVLSANGQTLLTQTIVEKTVQHNLNLSQLSVGTYFIVLTLGEEMFNLPFVKR